MSREGVEVPEAAEVLDRMTDAFFALDDDWRFTYLNERAHTLVAKAAPEGSTADEMRGRRIWDVVPAAADSVFAERYRTAVETGEPVNFEAEYEPIDTWFEVHAYPSDTGLSVYFRDITERKRREAQRERDRLALQSLYRIAADTDRSFEEKVDSVLRLGCDYLDVPFGMVNELDETGQTVAFAHGTPEGLQPGATMPRDEAYCKETVETDDLLAIVDAVEAGWGDDPAYEVHGLGCYIGGRIRVGDDVDRTLCFAGPEPREGSFTDTEETVVELLTQWLTYEFSRRADRRALERKNERLENLASVVSHDLRNPLTIAKARTDFIADDAPDEHVEAISDSLDRIEGLIDDLTTLARQGDVIDERSAVDLSSVVEGAWTAVPTGTASLEYEADCTLYADESRLQQVLENLFKNSVEHGDDGVHVTVRTTDEGFSVADDGPGIPPEEREKVLRMGYTTDDEGSGIGMAIVSEVVQAHGWTITVGESASGGARFDVTGVEPME
ncbi:PAS domain-containing sensor histidine kinase [Haloglomus litoreum]|uniref:sensor histidine kinase n=1 Tax=Haloglomus litoreum TaxID=3034026 RepID=UPI0023E86B67|nr:PAS domain-containing sensor histidine kinase [Haloglomus sp. DT116]